MKFDRKKKILITTRTAEEAETKINVADVRQLPLTSDHYCNCFRLLYITRICAYRISLYSEYGVLIRSAVICKLLVLVNLSK